MASVNDFGLSDEPLGAPALGGPDGWAAAVAAALNGRDETVDARIAALEAALNALKADVGYVDAGDAALAADIAAGDAALDAAKVNRAGDQMDAHLRFPGGRGIYWPAADTFISAYDDTDEVSVMTGGGAPKPLNVGNATAPTHAATKSNLDYATARGLGYFTWGTASGAFSGIGAADLPVPANYRLWVVTLLGPSAAAYVNIDPNYVGRVYAYYNEGAGGAPWVGTPCASWSFNLRWIAIRQDVSLG